jgi:hypothetical protein
LFGDALSEQTGFAAQLEKPAIRNLFHLGCQGPDLLFFHHFPPWQKKSMYKLGEAMHERECGPLLMSMADSARTAGAGSPLFLYVLGFMTHHLLDRIMHPYIFYRGGYAPWDHQRFEVAMDTLIVRRMRGIDTSRFPVWTLIDIGAALPEDAAVMLHKATGTLYPELTRELTSDDWKQAYRDMIRGHKLFHDPTGLKRLLTFGKIAPMVYKRRPPVLDFLNEARREWHHPCVREETSKESVMDLWEKALIEGEAMLRAMFDYAAADAADADLMREKLSRLVGNLSYDTGKSCEEWLPLQFADPIFR